MRRCTTKIFTARVNLLENIKEAVDDPFDGKSVTSLRYKITRGTISKIPDENYFLVLDYVNELLCSPQKLADDT
jgi:hypothetical protein